MTTAIIPPSSSQLPWRVGQLVEVQPRTWAGINRPGGHGKIVKLHCGPEGSIEGMDVKYTITGGFDKQLDPDLVKPHEELERGRRSRRTCDVFCPPTIVPKKEVSRRKEKLQNTTNIKNHSKLKNKPQRAKSKVSKKKRKRRELKRPHPKVISALDQNSLDGIPTVITIAARSPSSDVLSPLMGGVEGHPKRQYMLSGGRNLNKQVMSPLAKGFIDSDKSPSVTSWSNERIEIRGLCMSASSSSPLAEREAAIQYKTTSQNNDCPNPEVSRVHLTLREVYDGQRQSANEFINDVVENKDDSRKLSNAESQEGTKGNDQAEPEDEVSNRDPQEAVFLSNFNHLLQNNDGMIEEENILEKINQLPNDSGVLYVASDIDKYLRVLSEENKIMRSDGLVFSI